MESQPINLTSLGPFSSTNIPNSAISTWLKLTHDVVFLTDAKGKVVAASRKAWRELRCDAPCDIDLIDPVEGKWAFEQAVAPWSGPTRLLRSDGTVWHGRMAVHPVVGPNAQPLVLLIANTVMSRDRVTQIASREAFEDHLELLWSLAAPPTMTCFFVDLDRFKPINDKHGHSIGDEVLRVVAKRTKSSFRPDDFVARYGGDEFVAMVECQPDAARSIAQRLSNALRREMEVDGLRLQIAASIGVARGNPNKELVDAADRAMYLAKQAGGDCVHFAQEQ